MNQPDNLNMDAQPVSRTSRPGSDTEVGRIDQQLSKLIGNRELRSFADKAGLSEGTLRNLMKGGVPRLDSVLKIAEAAGVSIEWLASGEGDPDCVREPATPYNVEKPPIYIYKVGLDPDVTRAVIEHIDAAIGNKVSPKEKANLIVDLLLETQAKGKAEALRMLQEGPPQPES